jgi:hypothetical protein
MNLTTRAQTAAAGARGVNNSGIQGLDRSGANQQKGKEPPSNQNSDLFQNSTGIGNNNNFRLTTAMGIRSGGFNTGDNPKYSP